jgi:hypothetical protein
MTGLQGPNPDDLEEHDKAWAAFQKDRWDEAFRIYRSLADGGSPSAQDFLGWMYLEGKGVVRDPEMARTLFTRAAEAGYPWGKYHLGYLALCEENYAVAKRWLEAAASDDVLPAIFRLGVLYQLGLGVPANEEVACNYYERASQRGHVLARRNIAGIMLKRERSPWKRLKWQWRLFGNGLRGAWFMARNRYDARLGMQ